MTSYQPILISIHDIRIGDLLEIDHCIPTRPVAIVRHVTKLYMVTAVRQSTMDPWVMVVSCMTALGTVRQLRLSEDDLTRGLVRLIDRRVRD